jgi:predicted transcriptional regulator
MSSDDIVARLRQLASAMSEAKFPALEATALQAADEIERLRKERDEARREVRDE